MDKPPLIRRVVIHNYKSIAKCDVTLGRFNVFVGRNGAGKSNFLDALQFVSDCLSESLSAAFDRRNGIGDVLRHGDENPSSFQIEIELDLSTSNAKYKLDIALQPHGGFAVQEEELLIEDIAAEDPSPAMFNCQMGNLKLHADYEGKTRRFFADRLYLPVASDMPAFRQVYDALTGIGVFHPIPEFARKPHKLEPGIRLSKSGSNLTRAVSRLSRERPKTLARIVEYLAQIVPGLVTVQPLEIGGYEILEFLLQVHGESQPRKFQSQNMSDGTLRSLAVLVAALQFLESPDSSHVIGIEEPEAAIHPSAMAVLLDALREASVNTQILITTHSPDLVDGVDLDTDHLFAVSDTTGSTVIEPVDDASVMAIRTHLYSAGELLRMDQLEPRSVHSIEEVAPK